MVHVASEFFRRIFLLEGGFANKAEAFSTEQIVAAVK